MGQPPKSPATVAQILASTSDVLFPAEIGAHPVAVDSRGCGGDTPLHVMVWRGDLHAVGLLIEAGANVDAAGDLGETPLHVAVGQEDLRIIEALLKAGAGTAIPSEFNETPAERAERKGGEIAALFRRLAST